MNNTYTIRIITSDHRNDSVTGDKYNNAINQH